MRVQHAATGSVPEELVAAGFVERCEPYFADGGLMVEQPFQARLAEGMIRVYLSHDEVVGFAHQYPRGLMPPDEPSPSAEKVFHEASAPSFQALRRQVDAWVPELQAIVGVDRLSLPVIWDIDFLYGPKSARRRHVCHLRDQRELDVRVSGARDADGGEGGARPHRRDRLLT